MGDAAGHDLDGRVWRISVLPDAQRGVYVLPVKAAIRRAARVAAGDEVLVRVAVLGDD